MLSSLAQLRAQAQQNRIDFLTTDLALCFTFCDLIETETDHCAAEIIEFEVKM
jgi:hypothetical protein